MNETVDVAKREEVLSRAIDGVGYLVRENSLYGKHKEVSVFSTKAMNGKAMLAQEMMVRWGMVACVDGGEDSTGRAKVKLMEVEEVVGRAVKMADAAYKEFEARGWVLNVPSPT